MELLFMLGSERMNKILDLGLFEKITSYNQITVLIVGRENCAYSQC
jgi:hypothetical protein